MGQGRKQVVIGTVADFPPGKGHTVEIEGRSVAVFNVDSRFFALRNVCPHQGAPLSSGTVVGELSSTEPGHYLYDATHKRVRCPWHGWEYDLANGQSSFDPSHNRVRAFRVRVEEGAALAAAATSTAEGSRVPGPYVAETYPISVENDYVVVEV